MRLFKFFQRARKERKIRLSPQGNHHHLENIFHRMNSEYFEGKMDLKITWFSRNGKSPVRRRIILGSYHFQKRLIKIHRYLDQSHIPDYFVSYIVYHEMLHHAHPPIRGRRGKRSIHHAQFKQQEKLYKDYHLAMEFRKEMRRALFQKH